MITNDLKAELKQKERKISDLIRFIKTRYDNNPNYSLLLGSGCSVTSGIKSGGQLVDQWRKEIYLDLSNDYLSEYDVKKAKEYLKKNEGSWYNELNEYSSLFEKKYDLPRQRRMFVESEVSDVSPSIGYAYLINLIKKNYFNTIFTTNFDDLINEAFYQFSEVRPISCAHDSSIKSITVTSKRPKIIKLHGDYLFDDIKSTLRETESLEDNIRNKFVEFSKDYGLIVVGYGGYDRSIMDVLNYLLKHEDFYKHGIYWCIKKNDTIGEELRKLLWKERVYFIEIEGFDELFSELHNEILNNKFPIDTNFISNKSQEIIQKFIHNDLLANSNSEIIKKDLKNLSEQNEKNNLFELIKQFQEDKDKINDNLTNRELKILLEIMNLIKQESYLEALSLINEEVNSSNNKYFLEELYKEQIKIYELKSDVQEAKKICDRLIDLDKQNYLSYFKKFNLDIPIEEKLDLIENLIKMNPYQEEFYNKKALLELQRFNIFLDNEMIILNNLDKSLELNPSIENDAWEIKFDFLSSLNKESELKNIIANLKKQKPYYIDLLNMELKLIQKEKSELKDNFIEIIEQNKQYFLNENKLSYEILKIDYYSYKNDLDSIRDLFNELDTNDKYIKKTQYLNFKAKIYLEKFFDLKKGREILEESLKIRITKNALKQLIDLYIFSSDFDRAKELFDKERKIFNISEIYEIEKKIFIFKGEFEQAFFKFKANKELNIQSEISYISDEGYYLILNKKYQDAYKLLQSYLNKHNYCISLHNVVINYELSVKKLGQNVSIKRLEKIRESTKDKLVLAGVAALLGDKTEIYKNLDLALKENNLKRFEFKFWPIFDDINHEARFLKYYEF